MAVHEGCEVHIDTSNLTLSGDQRAEVSRELGRILVHPTFKTSSRCIVLLRFVVEQYLAGAENEIKERTLGIEVFGREAHYDVGADPIVRRVANEVRKRLAQYYQEDPEGHTVRIHLPRGGYIPEFELLADASPKGVQAPDSELAFTAPVEPPPPQDSSSSFRPFPLSQTMLALVALGLIVVAGLWLWTSNAFLSPIDRIWKPLLDANGAILVCLPDNAQNHKNPLQAKKDTPDNKDGADKDGRPDYVAPPSAVFRDMRVSNAVAMLMTQLNRRAELIPSSAMKYSDFQRGPVILIGGINNPWTQPLLSKLRYNFQFDPVARRPYVQDAFAPSSHKWMLADKPGAAAAPLEDYAILTRYFSKDTGQWIVALSGLSFIATQAAGEFVSDPKLAKLIPRELHGSGNFQLVLRVSIISEAPGPVQVVAFYTW